MVLTEEEKHYAKACCLLIINQKILSRSDNIFFPITRMYKIDRRFRFTISEQNVMFIKYTKEELVNLAYKSNYLFYISTVL